MSKDSKRRDAKGRVLKSGESQRKDGTYQFRYTQNGKREYVYAPTLKALRLKEDEIHRQLLLYGTPKTADGITLLDAVLKCVSFKNNCKPTTMYSYQESIKALRQFPFMDMRISDVSRTNAKAWLASLQNDGLKKSTLAIYHSLIRSSLENLVEDRTIPFNPFAFDLKFLKSDRTVRQPIPRDKWDKFVNTLLQSNRYRKRVPLFTTLYETGIRVSELCGLTVDSVDIENRSICINKQLQRDLSKSGSPLYVSSPKSAAGIRKIPLTDKAMQAIQAVLEDHCYKGPVVDGCTDFLFTTSKGTPLQLRNIDDYFKYATSYYNELHPDDPLFITPHVLRHSFATNLAKCGVSPKASQYLLGHSSAGVTLNVYTHYGYEEVADEFQRINE